MVYLAWPQEQRLDMAQPEAAKRLVNLFFFGQYMLASLMAPSFAAGAITGEKERMSYEMLLASPLRPGAIVLGKLFAALCHLGILMICSLPIVMLCLPLGGVSLYEVFAAYFGMICTVGLFGMISLWASSYFKRTSASLVVSYLMILPLAMVCVLMWNQLEQLGEARLLVVVTVVPIACLSLIALMWRTACNRLLYPPDLGSEGKEVVDLETEAREAVGLYIKRDEFPDRLFAPPKRTTFMEEGVNPIYDKEMRSEIFSQGTLMLRLVIQISMLLALFVMACCLYIWPEYAPWYISYVLLVQHAGRAGVFGRQRHQRARAADARPAARDARHAVADAVGQAALRAARVERADVVLAVAGAAGVRDAAAVLVQPADDGRLFAGRRSDLRDDRRDGTVLLDDFSEVVDQLDLHVPDHRRDVHGAAGDDVFRRDVFQRLAGSGDRRQAGRAEPVFGRVRAAARRIGRRHESDARRCRAICRCSLDTWAGRSSTTAC